MTPSRGNTILCSSSQQLPRLCLGPLKGFLSWQDVLQGPSTFPLRCFQKYRETRTLSCVLHSGQRSQDTVRNIWSKPGLCVCWKHTSFRCSKTWEIPGPLLWPPYLVLHQKRSFHGSKICLCFTFTGLQALLRSHRLRPPQVLCNLPLSSSSYQNMLPTSGMIKPVTFKDNTNIQKVNCVLHIDDKAKKEWPWLQVDAIWPFA